MYDPITIYSIDLGVFLWAFTFFFMFLIYSNSLSICCKASLVVLNSLNFCLSVNILISLLILNEILTEQ